MTDATLLVVRDGKWIALEVEYLTSEERLEKLGSDPSLIRWLDLVCVKLVKAEQIIKSLTEET